jgi:DNA-binding MarR family transcriptional regulator
MMRDAAAATSAIRELKLAAQALFGLLFLNGELIRPIDDALIRHHGTGITGYEVLVRLANMDSGGVSVRYLSDQVVLSPSRVSRLVDEFVQRGLLERATSPQDGRLSLVRLTDQGGDEADAIQGTFNQAIRTALLDRLSARQINALIDIGHTLGSPHC